MKNIEVLEALQWFYEHELELFKLEKKEWKTDEESLKYFHLSEKMMSVLNFLQKGLIEPCEEILELMIYRLKFLNDLFKKHVATLKAKSITNEKIKKEQDSGQMGWNHLKFIKKAIPRMKKNIENLKRARGYSDLKVAIDIMVNEVHWGYLMIQHITRHLRLKMPREKKQKARTLSMEIARLRNEMRKKKIEEGIWKWGR